MGDRLQNGSLYAIGPLSCLSVCDVGALWPNGWMDQDETLRAGRPRPWPYCVRRGPSSPSPKGAQPPIFGPYLLSANGWWIKVPLGMEVGVGPCNFVLDGDPAPPRQSAALSTFRPTSIVAKRSPISATAELLLLTVVDSHYSRGVVVVVVVVVSVAVVARTVDAVVERRRRQRRDSVLTAVVIVGRVA